MERKNKKTYHNDKKVSNNVIRRMPRYHSYLLELKDKGIERISSKELSKITGFTASQIRQDFNNFGGFGKQGAGYEVDFLFSEICDILGLNQTYKAVIFGAGNLGQAICNYAFFKEYGLKIEAIFDVNPSLIGNTIHLIDVLDVSKAKDFIKKNDISIAIVCVPKEAVPKVTNIIENSKIRGVWNFAPADINISKEIKVENVRLSDSLFVLSYMMNNNNYNY